MKGKPSAILSFGVQDGLEGGTRFMHHALQLFTRLVNIGDAKSLACHPATTTHRQLNEFRVQKRTGVKYPTVVHVCVGYRACLL